MLIFTPDSNCQAWELNATRLRHDEDFKDLEKQMLASVLPISLAALAANLISFSIFIRQKFDNRAIRLVLVSVSFWEVVLQSAVICEVITALTGARHAHTKAAYVATSVIRLGIGAAAFVRNWNMVILSASRCELVWRPLASRGRLFFSLRRLKACLAVLVVVAFCLSLLVQLEFYGVECRNLDPAGLQAEAAGMGGIVMRPWLASSEGDRPGYPSLVFYSLQCLLPPLIIPGPTIGMSLRLSRARRVSRRLRQHRRDSRVGRGSAETEGQNDDRPSPELENDEIAASPSSGRSCSAQGRARRAAFLLAASRDRQRCAHRSHQPDHLLRRQHRRTSVLVLALVLLFCALEAPTFLSTLCHFFFPQAPLLSRRFIFLANVLTVMDSLLNFFVYAAASASFRAEIRNALCCRRRNIDGCDQSQSLQTVTVLHAADHSMRCHHMTSTRTSSSGCSRVSR